MTRSWSGGVAQAVALAVLIGGWVSDAKSRVFDHYIWEHDRIHWAPEVQHYRIMRQDTYLGFVVDHSGQVVTTPGLDKEVDAVIRNSDKDGGYAMTIYTDATDHSFNETLSKLRRDTADLGCWNAGGYTPDLCCANGGWSLCWSGIFQYDTCCLGWQTVKDERFLELTRLAHLETITTFTNDPSRYSEYYMHPILYATMVFLMDTEPDREKLIAEVGVFNGSFATHFLDESKLLKTRIGHYYAIDPWLGDFMQEIFDGAIFNLKPYMPTLHIIQEKGAESSKMYDDSSLDFVFIDAVHDYEFVTLHLGKWWPKIRDGGVIAGHDFAREKPFRFPGCHRAAQVFAKKVCNSTCFMGLTGTTFAMIKGTASYKVHAEIQLERLRTLSK